MGNLLNIELIKLKEKLLHLLQLLHFSLLF